MLAYRSSSIIVLSSLLCIIVGDCISGLQLLTRKYVSTNIFLFLTFVLLHLLWKQFRNTIMITSILWSQYWKILTGTLWIRNWPQEVFRYFVVLFGLIFSPLHFIAYHVGKWYGIRKKYIQSQSIYWNSSLILGSLRLCLQWAKTTNLFRRKTFESLHLTSDI